MTQNTSFEFPFEYAQIEGLGKLFYPIVNVQVKTIRGWQEFEFLVDTGADNTTVPSHLLPVLGLKKSQLSQNTTLGVGGISVKTWEFSMPIKLEKTEVFIHCSAVETKHDSMPLLLGRKDVFEERFNLLIDSKRKVTVITENLS
ncbi:retroviral-like aspartic protease family protein [Candidatus Gottesmanbacteria bacterium]|nr:retroviral-like aspartic protease family protein [Candidatus Gottesmanbacteria bacterium]